MQINSFLLSLFWAETHLELLEQAQPDEAPMQFLGRPDTYANEFKNTQHFLRLNTPLPLSPPWMPRTKGQHFWTYYSGGITNANVNGGLAWQRLIPFRTSFPLSIKADPTLSPPLFECFFYPHGIAFGITLTWKNESSGSLEEAVDSAFKLRFDPQYHVTWEGKSENFYKNTLWPENADASLSMDKIAEHGLSIARTLAYGKGAIPGKLTKPVPFSVFTVLKGKDIALSKAMDGNGEIQKALHALTNWQQSRAGSAILVFDGKVSLGLGEEAGIADALYGQHRGRAIWYPSRFTTDDKNILYGLQCYHRNMFFASLQTESLCGFAESVTERLKSGVSLSVYQRELATKAGGTLGLLFGGHQDTYRSFSPCRHIQDNNWAEDVNTMRKDRGMPSLH